MQSPRLRIALLGGVPPALGGGGLEMQLARTAAALRALGHDARPVHDWTADDTLDIVHAFNHSGEVLRYIQQWRRNPARLVFSPVAVVAPGAPVTRLHLARHVPVASIPARALRVLGRKADIVVGLTAWEQEFMIRQAGIPPERCVVVGNGVEPVELGPAIAGLPERYVVSVGTVSARKGQAEIAAALAGHDLPYVVAGGYEGDDPDAFRAAVASTGGAWVGEVHDARVVRRLMSDAQALVLLSEREGQSLAVLEALAAATPVVASDLPANQELVTQHPEWVRIVSSAAEVAAGVRSAVAASATAIPPRIDTWGDVAEQLVERAYLPVMQRPARTGQER